MTSSDPSKGPRIDHPALSFPVHRVLLKLSGEALMGEESLGWDPRVLSQFANDIKAVHDKGIQVCVVIGGGNIYRGVQGAVLGVDRTTSDYMGMLGTVMNGLALQSALEQLGVGACVQSAIPMESVCEYYIRRRALSHLAKGRVVIFVAGTGNPYFTTDTCAVLRASEMNCDILLKGTKVDGIYTSDTIKDPKATRFEQVTHEQVIRDRLNVMDMAAIALARDNNLPVIIFSIKEAGCFENALQGKGTFTLVDTKEERG